MPAGDRTGPEGMGPMSGRGAGYCGGSRTPGLADRGAGRGFGRARGWGRGFGFLARGAGGGRGWRHCFHASGVPGWMRFGGLSAADQKLDPLVDKQALRSQAKALQAEIDAIKRQLGESGTDGQSE
jgi:hypothetical protein